MTPSLPSRVKWQAQNLYCKGIHLINRFRDYDPSDCVIICGSGRSGTTWLSEIIGSVKHATILDEPLKRTESKRIQKIGFSGAGQYIPQGRYDWPEAKNFFDDLFSGREFNPNHLHGNLGGLWQTEIWVLKFIRAHLSLPWIVDTYPVRKPIYLVRNPYAVVASQRNHPAWAKDLVKYKKPTSPYHEYFDQFEPIYSKIHNNIQFKAFSWALENAYLLNHSYHNKKWITISYEQIFQTPEQELKIIFKELNLLLTNKVFNQVQRSSQSTISEVGIGQSQTEKWKSQLNASEIDDISWILEKFKLDSFIYKA